MSLRPSEGGHGQSPFNEIIGANFSADEEVKIVVNAMRTPEEEAIDNAVIAQFRASQRRSEALRSRGTQIDLGRSALKRLFRELGLDF